MLDVKFVIQFIIGPLVTAAVAGLAWLAFNEPALFVDLGGKARALAYLTFAAIIVLCITAVAITGWELVQEVEKGDEDYDIVEARQKTDTIRAFLRFGLILFAWLVAIWLFFTILDGISQSANKEYYDSVSQPQSSIKEADAVSGARAPVPQSAAASAESRTGIQVGRRSRSA